MRAKLRIGNWIRMNRMMSMTNAKGSAPIKTSFRDIRSSLIVDLMTKHEIPNGGVSKPISAPTTVMIPNQISVSDVNAYGTI